jgi:predicted CXXCH cytochrome family protein
MTFARILIAAIILAAVATGLWVVWPTDRSSSPTKSSASLEVADSKPKDVESLQKAQSIEPIAMTDPRFTYETIFRNIKPNVKYVGDESCAMCHEELCETFHAHPMGRSAAYAGTDSLEQYDAKAKNPCQVGPYELSVRREDGQMIHSVTAKSKSGELLPPLEMPVRVAIGSGTRGRSYLMIQGEHVWQSPISWFSNKSRWDISPGFDLGIVSHRPIVSACLYCHVNQFDHLANTANGYREPINAVQLSIGCERCHGPGELHVTERTVASTKDLHLAIDTSIVNPAHLSPDLQMSICAQCHLRGRERVVRRGREETEFRPGMPFEMFVTAFLAHPDSPQKNTAVSHFDQMEQVKCVNPNGQRLLCTSCHDPHQATEKSVADPYYNQQCAACHQQQTCSAPASDREQSQDNCVRCHMPKGNSADIAHTSVTDHRILRHSKKREATSALASDEVPLVLYRGSTLPQTEVDRDLGIALARFANKQPTGTPTRQIALNFALERLTDALSRWPDDVDTWLALSVVHTANNEPAKALEAAEKAMLVSPRNEAVLAQLAEVTDGAGKLEQSQSALTELLQLHPTSPDYLLKRMISRVASGDWIGADSDCSALLAINPVSPTARLVRGLILYGNGDEKAGRSEVDTAMALATTPQQRTSIKGWFDRFVAWRSKVK